MILKVGTRPSRLAIRQVEEIAGAVGFIRFEIAPIWTAGDKDKTTPLFKTEGSDFFTREIELALLNGDIDIAVHSAKDMEEAPPAGLTIAALTRSISPYECLVSKDNRTLGQLSAGAIIGTSSRKRKDALIAYRGDFIVKDIRGDIEERLGKLDAGDFDAIIAAHAALIRLGLEGRVSDIIPPAIIEPHPLQGRLAVQVRDDRPDLISIFGRIHAG